MTDLPEIGASIDRFADLSGRSDDPTISGVSFEISGFEIGMVEVTAAQMGIPTDQVFVAGARIVVDEFQATGRMPDSTFYENLGYFTDI